MLSATDVCKATQAGSPKLLEALIKACEAKIKEASDRGQFSAVLKGSELNQRYTRNYLVDELRKAGYEVPNGYLLKFVNDVLIEETGEVVIKWEANPQAEGYFETTDVVPTLDFKNVETATVNPVSKKKVVKKK